MIFLQITGAPLGTPVVLCYAQGRAAPALASKLSIEAAFSRVKPMSSNPFNRQCLRNGSMSNLIPSPSDDMIVCSSRLTSTRAFAPFSASLINRSTCSCGSTIGSIPFLKQLLKKMSANDVETTTLIPKSDKAHGACSRDDPQPKLSPAMRIDAS